MRDKLGLSSIFGNSESGEEAETKIPDVERQEPSVFTNLPPVEKSQHSKAERAESLKQNLNSILATLQHARAEANEFSDLITGLETEAAMVDHVREKNTKLELRAEELGTEVQALKDSNDTLNKELARSNEQILKTEGHLDKAKREKQALMLASERNDERYRSQTVDMNELDLELQSTTETKKRLEIDNENLHSELVERDRECRTLLAKENELRLQSDKDSTQIRELIEESGRKERKLAELMTLLEKRDSAISKLEEQYDQLKEELRSLELKTSDMQVSYENRIYTLTSSHSQEHAGHRVTRKLLDELRTSSQTLADENKTLKDQTSALGQELQQAKLELGTSRRDAKENGSKLHDVNLRYAAAQDDIQRLEALIESNKKEARDLKRTADKVSKVETENSQLLDKIANLQSTLDNYRKSAKQIGETPLAFPSIKDPEAGEAENERPAGGANSKVTKMKQIK